VKLPIFALAKAFTLQQSKEIWNKERKFGTKKGNLEQRKEIWAKIIITVNNTVAFSMNIYVKMYIRYKHLYNKCVN